MSFTYGNDPQNSNRDAVRVLINDTAETGHKISDETITWLLSSESSVWYAAAAAADIVAGQLAADAQNKRVGDLSIGDQLGAKAAQYRILGDQLRMTGHKKVGAFSGGISIADKDTQRTDTDWNLPDMTVGMHDNETGPANSTSGRVTF